MIEDFSAGYYRMDMKVQPYDAGPVIPTDLYDYINRRFYADSSSPITMRIGLSGGPMFTVDAEKCIPAETLALPLEWMDDMGIPKSTTGVSVFILKPEHSYFINQSIFTEESGENYG